MRLINSGGKGRGKDTTGGQWSLFAPDHLTGSLVGGEDEDFGNLDVRRSGGGVEGYIGYVVTREGRNASVEALGGCSVAVETNVGEVGFDETRLDIGDADGGLVEVHAETVTEGLDSSFGGTVGAAAGIGGVAGYGTDVDDMTTTAFDHARNDETCHHEQSLDVSVNHGEAFVEIAFVLLVDAKSETGVVDEHVDGAIVGGKLLDGGFGKGAVANVEREEENVGAVTIFKLLLEGLEFIDTAGVEDETMANLGELAGAGLANAGGCAGDEGEKGVHGEGS